MEEDPGLLPDSLLTLDPFSSFDGVLTRDYSSWGSVRGPGPTQGRTPSGIKGHVDSSLRDKTP